MATGKCLGQLIKALMKVDWKIRDKVVWSKGMCMDTQGLISSMKMFITQSPQKALTMEYTVKIQVNKKIQPVG